MFFVKMMHFHCEMQTMQRYKEERKNHLRFFPDVTVTDILMNNFSDIFLFMDTYSHPWLWGMESYSTFGSLPCLFSLYISALNTSSKHSVASASASAISSSAISTL